MQKRKVFNSIIIKLLLSSFFIGILALAAFGDEQLSIISKPDSYAVVGVPYIYQIIIDGNTARINFELLDAPEGMSIEKETGIIKWTPQLEQVGEHRVKIKANNDTSQIEQEFSLITDTFKLSSILAKPDSIDLEGINSSKKIESVYAVYEGNEKFTRLLNKTECVFSSNNTNIATVNREGIVEAKNIGTTEILISYTENEITESVTVSVMVTFPALPIFGGG